MTQLVLFLFPGADLLGLAFEMEGFCVVQGPDILFGRDVRDFHPVDDRFDGIIGGPPCQAFSRLVHIVRANGFQPRHGNLIPEFERIVEEAQPTWWLMENVESAPVPNVEGYSTVSRIVQDNVVGGRTMRRRRFTYGDVAAVTARRFQIDIPALEPCRPISRAVTADPRDVSVAIGGSGKVEKTRKGMGGRLPRSGAKAPLEECCRLQGVPPDFFKESPLTKGAQYQVIGNAVPLPKGRSVARGVKKALGLQSKGDL